MPIRTYDSTLQALVKSASKQEDTSKQDSNSLSAISSLESSLEKSKDQVARLQKENTILNEQLKAGMYCGPVWTDAAVRLTP
jgi:hypothetical protein